MSFARSALGAGIPFGLAMTVFFTFQMGLRADLVAGPISGLFFGVAIAGFAALQRKRMGIEGGLLDGEPIVHQGPANHMRGAEARGGWLVLTERALVFRSHGLNFGNAPLRLDLAEVRAFGKRNTLGIVPNGLRIDRVSGPSERFVVGGREEWLRALAARGVSRA